jgi:acyl-CoA synthetase (NDP forming)
VYRYVRAMIKCSIVSVTEVPLNKDKLNQFEAIFNPQSIAIVGASKGRKVGGRAVHYLLAAGYKGKVFPVNPAEKEILGLKTYPSVREIPEPVDYVIMMVPMAAVLRVIDDCVAKGVKAVQLFTAGFSESGEEEGARLEREMVARVRKAGIRLVGPNCAGISVPPKLIPLETTGLIGQPGDIAVLAQSGGNAEVLADAGLSRGIYFSKLISFGNASDLNAIDFLEYLKEDPETRIIALYLEGITDGRRLYQLIAEISQTKPVVFLKGGRTEAGKEMAASHTASLAGSQAVWAAAMKQAGDIEVDSLEEMADTLMALQYLPPLSGNRVVVISQLGGGAGGAGVLAADICTGLGLELPPFTQEIKDKIKSITDPPGSILRNPLDLSLLGREPVLLRKVLEVLADLPDIDLIMLNERPTFLLALVDEAELHTINNVLVDFHSKHEKPLVVMSPPGGMYEAERVKVEKRLAEAGIPVYPSFDRAAEAITNVIKYWRFRNNSLSH